MDRTALVARLRAHEPELKAVGVLGLSIFGSVARGDDTAASDVDLAVRIDPAARMSLLKFVGLKNRLSDILGRDVDLVEEPARKAFLQEEIERDRLLVLRDRRIQ